jgi:hypothetical protein
MYVHAKWTAGSPAEPLASGARFSSRHCKGAPATPFPPLQMASIITTALSIASLRSNTGKIRQPVGRQAVDWDLVVLKSALSQSHYNFLRHFLALRPSALEFLEADCVW